MFTSLGRFISFLSPPFHNRLILLYAYSPTTSKTFTLAETDANIIAVNLVAFFISTHVYFATAKVAIADVVLTIVLPTLKTKLYVFSFLLYF
jgi:hypothetical protein